MVKVDMLNLDITNDSTLEAAAGYLHDGAFEKDSVQYDATQKTLSIQLWREVLDEANSERIFLFLYRWRFTHRSCVLTFYDVDACDLQITDNLTQYLMRDMRFNSQKNELQILTACCLKIILRVHHLKGTLRDLGQITDDSFRKTTISFSGWAARTPTA